MASNPFDAMDEAVSVAGTGTSTAESIATDLDVVLADLNAMEAEVYGGASDDAMVTTDVATNTGIAGPVYDLQRQVDRARIRIERMRERAEEDGQLSDTEIARLEGRSKDLEHVESQLQDLQPADAGAGGEGSLHIDSLADDKDSTIDSIEDELGIDGAVGDVYDAIGSATDDAEDVVHDVTGGVDEVVNDVGDEVIDGLDSVTDGAVSSVLDGVGSVAGDAVDTFGDVTGISSATDMLGGQGGLGGLVEGGVVETAGDALSTGVRLTGGAAKAVVAEVDNAADVVEDVVDEGLDTVEEVVGDPGEAISDAADVVVDAGSEVVDAGSDLIDAGGDVLDDIF